jgi:phosphoribosyl-ATP pyrophosphohydrolase
MTDMIDQLEQIIQDRRNHPSEKSYTSGLFASGRHRVAQKVGEEAVEVVVASLSQPRQQQVEELADLLFHTLVLMADLGITLDDVRAELAKRHQLRKEDAE